MDESLAAGVPEAGMALVSALDDALRIQGSAGKREGEGGLKALDDVDMDMDIDVDVFRPSAMLDTRLDEEFGSARDFGGLWHGASGLGCLPVRMTGDHGATDFLCGIGDPQMESSTATWTWSACC